MGYFSSEAVCGCVYVVNYWQYVYFTLCVHYRYIWLCTTGRGRAYACLCFRVGRCVCVSLFLEARWEGEAERQDT